MSSVFINPVRHVVMETPTAKLFRKRLKFDDVFTYFNRETGQWVLAYWLNKRARLADEVEDLGPGFEVVSPSFIDQIVQCWGHVDWKAKKARLLSQERTKLRRESEAISEQQERFDWLKKKLIDKTTIPYAFDAHISGGGVS